MTANYAVPTLNGLPLTWDYPVHGLAGEAGEVAERFKRIIRERGGKITTEDKEKIQLELSDVLWYISEIATVIGLSLDTIATSNIKKLSIRAKENKIHGEGSER